MRVGRRPSCLQLSPLQPGGEWVYGGGGSNGSPWLITQRGARAGAPVLSLFASWTLTGEQTKALVTQLTLFNQILVELRDDIRDQV